jgi:hypothetical protein
VVLTVVWDNIAPVVSSIVAPASPANSATLVVTYTFSETVTGVAAASFDTTGSAAAPAIVITGSGATRTVTLTPAAQGNVVIRVRTSGSGITDTALNAFSSTAANALQTILWDTISPVVSAASRTSASPTKTSPMVFSYSFTETNTVQNVTSAAFEFTGSTAGTGGTATGLTVLSMSGSGNGPYTVNVGGMAASGTVQIRVRPQGSGVRDPVGNYFSQSAAPNTFVTGACARELAFLLCVGLRGSPRGLVCASGIAPCLCLLRAVADDLVRAEC